MTSVYELFCVEKIDDPSQFDDFFSVMVTLLDKKGVASCLFNDRENGRCVIIRYVSIDLKKVGGVGAIFTHSNVKLVSKSR